MTDTTDIQKSLDRLARENAELSGVALATRIILTQLLQSMTLREMNPQSAATKLIASAATAIEGLRSDGAEPLHPDMKAQALVAVREYEEQIRSVLPI